MRKLFGALGVLMLVLVLVTGCSVRHDVPVVTDPNAGGAQGNDASSSSTTEGGAAIGASMLGVPRRR